MAEYITFLFLGLGNGAAFGALAVALVVTYRSSGVLNFATGAISLYAAYTYAFLRRGEILNPVPPFARTFRLGDELGFLPAFALTLVISGLLGAVLYLAIFRLLRHALPAAKAVASLGVMTFLTALVAERAGGNQVLVADIFPSSTMTVGDVRLSSDRLWFAVTIVALALALSALYRYTRFGLRTRAAAETEVGAFVSGLAPDRIALANWVLSAVVAGVAGVLIAPLTPLLPGTYTLFIVPALAAAVLARFSLIGVAVAGGIVIGMLQSLGVFLPLRHDWLPDSGISELIPLAIVFVLLVVRGRPLPTRGSLVERTLGGAPRPRRIALPAVAGTAVGVLAIFVLDAGYRAALMTTFIFAIISLSLVVVTGYVGQISLAQLSLAGVAGFLLSTFGDSWGIPFPIAPLLAALGATVIGVLVGLPALRIRGLLVGVVTLMLAVAIEAAWFRNSALNGGSGGSQIPNPELFGVDLGIGAGENYPRPIFGLLCLGVLVLTAVGVAKLRSSSLGSAMLAVRANERSAAAAGISVIRTKLIGFGIGAFIAGIGGALLAYKQTNVTYDSFSALAGLSVFSTAFLAGVTSVSGGVLAGVIGLGGLLFVTLERQIEIGHWYNILAGLALVYTIVQHPEGLAGTTHVQLARLRRRRRSDEPVPARPAPAIGPSCLPVETDVTVLALQGLSVRYGGILAVDDVTLNVHQGQIAALIGPNGAGKTSCMDAISGFADAEGAVELDGRLLGALAPHARARLGLGRTFQSLDLYEELTVVENVVAGQYVGATTFGSTPATDPDHVERILEDLGIDHLSDRGVGEISQGQRQLVSIARALAGRPRLLLLDEPAAGLDSTESLQLADRLRRIQASGVSMLLVDHDMSFVLGLCDQVHVLDFGKLIASGPPEMIRTDLKVAQAYLGTTSLTAVAP